MADATAKTLNQYIQHLVVVMRADPRTDAELLGRFVNDQDEATFAVLMGRYASLVWENCRRVLGSGPDAEDAFQATFLALARQAATLRGETLARWLYRVSQRVAFDCRRTLRRRMQRETRVAIARQLLPDAATDDEKLIWEEVANLPDRLRVPVTLCYLDGKTQAETGAVLGVSVRSVARRLEHAITELRDRLARRGFAITVAALGAVLSRASVSSATPVLSVEFLRQVAAATAQGRVSPNVMDLAARAVAPRLGRWIIGMLALVALSGVCSAAWLLSTETKKPNPPVMPLAELPPQSQPEVAALKRDTPAPWASFKGKVTDEVGQPVPQAKLAVLGRTWNQRGAGLRDVVLAESVTDADGQFHLGVKDAFVGEVNVMWLMATTPTARTVVAVPVAGGVIPNNIAVRLTPGQVTGRVFDPKGQPLPGAVVRVTRFGGAAFEPVSGAPPLTPPDIWPAPVTTGADGRFTFPGLDPTVDVKLGIAHASGAAALVNLSAKGAARRDVEVQLLAARRLTGRVFASDTGLPFANAQVGVNFQSVAGAPPLIRVVRTDANGKFSLGVPVSPRWVVDVTAVPLPYVNARREVLQPAGDGEIVLDIPMPRGVVARGRVIDAGTKKPIALAKVRYFPPADTINANETSGLLLPSCGTKPDGSFALALPPVGGLLTITAPGLDYVLMEVDAAETLGRPCAAHSVLNLEAGSEPPETTFALERGCTIHGRAVLPDGQPVPNGTVYCSQLIGGRDLQTPYTLTIEDGRFAIPGCRLERTYTVFLSDSTMRYGTVAQLAWSDKPAAVKLQPTGTATVEVRDNADQLQSNAVVSVELGLPLDAAPGDERTELRWHLLAFGGAVGADGQRQLPGLIPGARYRIGVERGRGFDRAETILTVQPGGHRQTTLVRPAPALK